MSDVTIRISAVDNASQTLRNVANALGGVSTAAGGPTGQSGVSAAFTMAKNALGAFGITMGAIQVTRFLGEMRDLGQSAASTERAFLNLNGGTREAAATLGAMRTATRGVVEDIDLMAGANRLLLMGLASNTQEVAKLTEIAVTLGRVMGKDASQAVEDFSLLLANRSILRLDNFGISAANVRARIEELKEAGYGVEEAFRLAVLAEGEVAMGKVGDAAAVAATAWDALAVKIANVKLELAGVVYWLGELAATVLLNPMDTFDPNQAIGAGVSATQTEAYGIYGQVGQLANERFQGQFTENDVYNMTAAIVNMQEGRFADIQAAGYAVGLNEGQFRALEVIYAAVSGTPAGSFGGRGVTSTTGTPLAGMQTQRNAIEQAERAARQAQYATSAASIQGVYGPSTMGLGSPVASATLSGRAGAVERQRYVDFQNQYGAGGVGGWYGMTDTGTAAGQQQVAELRQGALSLLGDVVGRVADIGGNFITSAGRIRDAMAAAAAYAARVPETLNEWLSQGKPTGVEGELYSAIAGQMEGEGADTFLRGTGMIGWREDLISNIAKMEPEQATVIARNVGGWLAGGGQSVWNTESVAGAMNASGFYNAATEGEDWRFLPSYMTGGQGGVKMAPTGIEVESNGMVTAIDEASARLDEFDGQAADVIERPRTMPIDLSFVADLSTLSPLLRPIVEQIMAGMDRSKPVGTGGGAARGKAKSVVGFGTP